MPRSLVRDLTAEREALFSANIEKYMTLRNKSNDDIAEILGISPTHMFRLRKSPGSMGIDRALRLIDYLGFSDADKAEVIGIKLQVRLGGNRNV